MPQKIMPFKKLQINHIPAVIYGQESAAVYIFLHGKCGCKEEAAAFAAYVCERGWQVLAIDLPEHGERRTDKDAFNPWCVIPELQEVMCFVRERWTKVGLRANSIGAWFALLSWQEVHFEKCLFVSPVVAMDKLIQNMMQWAGVTPEQLYLKQQIATSFGETLSWRYLQYVQQHPLTRWEAPTSILYAGQDDLTDRDTITAFAARFNCQLTIMENGEHWFHTPEQLQVLQQWTEKNIGSAGSYKLSQSTLNGADA